MGAGSTSSSLGTRGNCRTEGAWRGQDSCPAAGLAGTPPWRARAFPPPSRFSKHPELGWLGLDRFRPPTAPQTRDKKRTRGWILSQHLFRPPFFFWPVPSLTKAVEKVPEPAPSQRRCGSPAATRWLPQTRHALFFPHKQGRSPIEFLLTVECRTPKEAPRERQNKPWVPSPRTASQPNPANTPRFSSKRCVTDRRVRKDPSS